MRKLPPLLEDRSPGVELALLLIGPIALGIVSGLLLTSTKGGYLIVQVVAILGGIGAGFEHRTALEGFYRGLVGGLLYGATILIVFDLQDKAAKADLPDHESLLIAITTVGGVLLGML